MGDTTLWTKLLDLLSLPGKLELLIALTLVGLVILVLTFLIAWLTLRNLRVKHSDKRTEVDLGTPTDQTTPAE